MSHTRSSLFSDEELDQLARDSAKIRAIKEAFDVEYQAQLAKLTAEASLDAIASHARSVLPIARAAAAGSPPAVVAGLAVLEAILAKLTP